MNKKALAIALTLSLMMSLAVAAAQGIKPQIHTTKNPTLSEKRMLKDFGSNVQVIQMNNTFWKEVVLLDRYHKKVGGFELKEESSKAEESSSKPEESSQPQESSSKVEESSKPQESSKPEESSKPQGSSSTPEESSSAAHEHNWQPVITTIHHEEEGHWETVTVKEAWDEQVVVKEAWEETVEKGEWQRHSICKGCGAFEDLMSDEEAVAHGKNHIINGIESGSYTDTVWVVTGTETIHHEAEYKTVHHEAETKEEWVVDKAAWDEEVVTGYKCSTCGAEK